MTRFLIYLFLFFPCLSIPMIHAESVQLSNLQKKVFADEYQTMSKMRYKLRELLENQDLSNTLAQGNDVFTSFYHLEQWLTQLQSEFTEKTLENFMEILQAFEAHFQSVLEQQEEVMQTLPRTDHSNNPVEVSLEKTMQQVKQLVEEGRIEEAKNMLRDLLAIFQQQQQQLQQSLDQYYDSKYSAITKILEKWSKQLEQAQHSENQILQEVLSPTRKELVHYRETQREITAMSEQMIDELQKIEMPLLSLGMMEAGLQQVRHFSHVTENQMQKGIFKDTVQGIENTKISLTQLNQSLQSMQQRIQRMSRPQRSNRQGKSRPYWSQKAVQPFRFEYTFEANPMYRGEIQQFNQSKYSEILPQEKQYLREVMK